MLEARKDINEAISLRDIVLYEGVKVPDFSLNTGEILWMEMENPNWSRLLVPFFNGLLRPQKGKYILAGKDIAVSEKIFKIVSCIDIGFNYSASLTLNSIVRWIAYNKQVNPAQMWGNCKRILTAMGCEYAAGLEIKKMAVNTIKKINTAISLSIPRLVIILDEPFLGLEKDGRDFVLKEIESLAADGSSIIVFSQDKLLCRVDKNMFLETFQ